MQKDACYQVGFIRKTHALQGEVLIDLEVDNPLEYEGLESIFIELKGQLVPYFVEQIAVRKDQAIVKFEGIDTLEQAQKLVKALLYLPTENLPATTDGKVYYHEILGFEVVDTVLGAVGKVVCIYDHTPQELIGVSYQGGEALIPWVEEIVLQISMEEQKITVELPEGLLDLYLENE